MTTSDATPGRPGRREGTGITLRAFRVNAAVNHLMFAGRRGRVYDRIVALSVGKLPLLHYIVAVRPQPSRG